MKKLLFLFVLSGVQILFSQNTYVPDDNFENYLETHDAYGNAVSMGDSNSLGDGLMNDSVPTAKINNIATLNINNLNIADLTGIEDFASLTRLQCYHNQISSLDVSQNTGLLLLNCAYNQLNSLNVSQNTDLKWLYCNDNQITGTIDLSNNPALLRFSCSNNQLTSLDISNNTLLTWVWCIENQLTSLNTGSNTNLTELSCYQNQLTGLDLSQNTALTKVYVSNNQLTSLDIQNGNNSAITVFDATNNPDLTCIFVDDTSASYLSSWYVDATSHFVETQAECDVLATGENPYEQAVMLYPNPVDDELVISKVSGFEITGITIYNMPGNIVYQSGTISGKINTKHLKNGIYFVQLQGAGHTVTRKLIVEH